MQIGIVPELARKQEFDHQLLLAKHRLKMRETVAAAPKGASLGQLLQASMNQIK